MKVFINTNPRWSGGYLAHLKGILTNGYVPDDVQLTIYGTQRLFDAIGPMDDNVEVVVDNTLLIDVLIEFCLFTFNLLSKRLFFYDEMSNSILYSGL